MSTRSLLFSLRPEFQQISRAFFVVIYINFHYNYLDDKINIIIFALELNNICSDGVIGSRAGLKIL